MKKLKLLIVPLLMAGVFTSCVSKKKYVDSQSKWKTASENLLECNDDLISASQDIAKLKADLAAAEMEVGNVTKYRQEQIQNLKEQITDLQKNRDQQVMQVEGLTVLSQAASNNVDKTLTQLGEKDRYINLLQAARNKVDSINLALAVNLKSSIGLDLDDKDVDIKVDKTVVMINLSDAMMYNSGSFNLTPRAKEVLGKISKIIKSRPELEVMVEGYTDNQPINNAVAQDNWELSVKRSTSVIRVLQDTYGVDPNRLIAAGRGEYNTMVPNNSTANMAMNRRTRIILMPKLNQFYDLLNPDMVSK
ncbi:OmpA family protein [uncultured Arcticibacterium sp.]|uniref:OmpA/MotB family protein n=1 Tax=uncultured Arcticibacterium sp. TaxID=2173042 RepID=UPI0030F80E58